MTSLLAQQAAAPHQNLDDWLARANQWLADLPNAIDRIDLAVAGLFVVLGIVSLLYGFRIVKGVVIVYSSVAGAAAGWYLATDVFARADLWWVGLLVGGAVMALLAWPLANFFIGLYGAIAGGLAGYAVTHAVGDQRTMLVGVAIGVIVGGILAVVIFRFMVIVMTSILGAHMAVVGIVALLYRVDRIAEPLRSGLTQQRYMLPLVMAAPALVGIIYQLYRTEGHEGKEDRDTGDKE